MQIKRTTKLLGLGAIAACGVCLVPLAIPLAVGISGLGMLWGGYIAVGGVALAGAGYLWFRRHRKRCECC
jgi:hypothetical protein